MLCPYYKKIDGKEIQCESPVKGAGLQLNLRNARAAREHLRCICGSFYFAQRCPIARMNDKKYYGGNV